MQPQPLKGLHTLTTKSFYQGIGLSDLAVEGKCRHPYSTFKVKLARASLTRFCTFVPIDFSASNGGNSNSTKKETRPRNVMLDG